MEKTKAFSLDQPLADFFNGSFNGSFLWGAEEVEKIEEEAS